MITMFKTESGAKYNVDEENKMIRRIGEAYERGKQRADGRWRPYTSLFVEVGKLAWIFWPDGTPLLDGSCEGATPATKTSPVVEVTYGNS
jgi:hypothetical protein